jgi:hypothetical protein
MICWNATRWAVSRKRKWPRLKDTSLICGECRNREVMDCDVAAIREALKRWREEGVECKTWTVKPRQEDWTIVLTKESRSGLVVGTKSVIVR